MRFHRLVSWVNTPRGLVCLFAAGLTVRLVIARISEGLWFDVTLFRLWSDRLVERGPSGFYLPPAEYEVDYPPGYLYVLLALGKASRALLGGPPSTAMLKLPAMLTDLGVAVLAMLLAARVTPASMKDRIRAVAAAAILFNPGLVLTSAAWGQVDSVLALFVLAIVYTLAGPPNIRRESCAVGLFAVAAASKPQVVFALPILGVFLVWRHMSDGWSALGRLTALALLGGAVAAAMFLPFGVSPIDMVGFYGEAPSRSLYPFTSLWAFNVWGAAGFYRPDVGAGAVRIGGVAAMYVGLAAFALMTAAIVVRCWKSLVNGLEPETVVLFGAAAMTCAAFSLLTRMHERYLYLAVVALTPLVADRRFRWALAVLSICFLLNVHFVYVLHSHQASPPGAAWTIQPLYDLLFGHAQDAAARKALSVITAASCLGVAFLGWRWLDPMPRRVTSRKAGCESTMSAHASQHLERPLPEPPVPISGTP
ncbi:MAG: hypothetical protein ACRD3C_26735 [Vicinamibacterales bacterium]